MHTEPEVVTHTHSCINTDLAGATDHPTHQTEGSGLQCCPYYTLSTLALCRLDLALSQHVLWWQSHLGLWTNSATLWLFDLEPISKPSWTITSPGIQGKSCDA
jgi:hypothetical protein